MLKAIETRYRGYRFRSRLEARWACFFDHLGVSWEYEKEGFNTSAGPYLPDFWLPKWTAWIEIKPEALTPGERQKARALADEHRPVVVLIGTPGEERVELFAHSSSNSGAGSFDSDEIVGPPGYSSTLLGYHDGRLVVWVDTDSVLLDRDYKALAFAIEADSVEHDPKWSLVGAVHALRPAYDAARSARFEHGESGYAPRLS